MYKVKRRAVFCEYAKTRDQAIIEKARAAFIHIKQSVAEAAEEHAYILRMQAEIDRNAIVGQAQYHVAGVEANLTAQAHNHVAGVEANLTAQAQQHVAGVEANLTAQAQQHVAGLEARLTQQAEVVIQKNQRSSCGNTPRGDSKSHRRSSDRFSGTAATHRGTRGRSKQRQWDTSGYRSRKKTHNGPRPRAGT